ncbi:hypothetical protein BZA77DRAFT_314148 [Pyronema omphalodes]|nr:hypothetical protein BZA77DRAFT_314148 [Pyronema omphalodes]
MHDYVNVFHGLICRSNGCMDVWMLGMLRCVCYAMLCFYVSMLCYVTLCNSPSSNHVNHNDNHNYSNHNDHNDYAIIFAFSFTFRYLHILPIHLYLSTIATEIPYRNLIPTHIPISAPHISQYSCNHTTIPTTHQPRQAFLYIRLNPPPSPS